MLVPTTFIQALPIGPLSFIPPHISPSISASSRHWIVPTARMCRLTPRHHVLAVAKYSSPALARAERHTLHQEPLESSCLPRLDTQRERVALHMDTHVGYHDVLAVASAGRQTCCRFRAGDGVAVHASVACTPHAPPQRPARSLLRQQCDRLGRERCARAVVCGGETACVGWLPPSSSALQA